MSFPRSHSWLTVKVGFELRLPGSKNCTLNCDITLLLKTEAGQTFPL